MNNRTLVLLVLILSVFIVAGCASKTPEPVTYTIEMTEYAFTPDRLEAKVGQQVTLELLNKGQLPHEIMFGRDVMMMENRPSGYQQDMFELAGIEPTVSMMMVDAEHSEEEGHAEGDNHGEEEHHGFMVLLSKTGDKATMTFTVTEEMVGEWEIGCFELDGVHYTAGMIGTFIVTE